MLLLLILISGLFIYLTNAGILLKYQQANPFRHAFIYTLICISGLVFISAELLSLLNAVSEAGIIITWILILTSSLYLWRKQGKYIPKKSHSFNFSGLEKFLAGAILFILFITGFIALTAYPNNWDSMTYHLSRVMFWIQNKNVNHFPTQIDRQISQPPLAEYFILHFRLLSSNDRFANLVQWLFMCGSIVVVAAMTALLNAKRPVQLTAAFLTAAIPMGILQSTSTQNDYVESFFIVSALFFLLRCLKDKYRFFDSSAFIICCALALATKGTAYVYLPVLIIFWLLPALKNITFRNWKPFIISCCLAVTFFLPQCIRNEQTYQSFTGPHYDLQNASFGVAQTLSNISKNIALHLKTPFNGLNACTEKAVTRFNSMIGMDVNSPDYSWEHSPPFGVGYFSTHEDSAGNLLHALLFMLCLILFFFRKKLRSDHLLQLLLIAVACMFIIFCSILKWQTWNTRLQLPVFVSVCPFLAIVCWEFTRKLILRLTISLFFLSSCVFLFVNQTRPIAMKENIFNTPSYTQYFETNKDLQKTFFDLSGLMWQNDLRNIGWVTKADTWEYPMWVIMQPMPGFKMQNILVESASKKYETEKPFSEFIPDAIIVTRFAPDATKSMTYKGRDYYLTYDRKGWYMYEIKRSAPK